MYSKTTFHNWPEKEKNFMAHINPRSSFPLSKYCRSYLKKEPTHWKEKKNTPWVQKRMNFNIKENKP